MVDFYRVCWLVLFSAALGVCYGVAIGIIFF